MHSLYTHYGQLTHPLPFTHLSVLASIFPVVLLPLPIIPMR